MPVDQQAITVTTATGGGVTDYVPQVGSLTGRIAAVEYVKAAGGSAFASTADLTITSERTGENVWTESNVNASKTVRPLRQGATASGATATSADRLEGVVLFNDRVKVVVAQGGNTKQGTFRVTVI